MKKRYISFFLCFIFIILSACSKKESGSLQTANDTLNRLAAESYDYLSKTILTPPTLPDEPEPEPDKALKLINSMFPEDFSQLSIDMETFINVQFLEENTSEGDTGKQPLIAYCSSLVSYEEVPGIASISGYLEYEYNLSEIKDTDNIKEFYDLTNKKTYTYDEILKLYIESDKESYYSMVEFFKNLKETLLNSDYTFTEDLQYYIISIKSYPVNDSILLPFSNELYIPVLEDSTFEVSFKFDKFYDELQEIEFRMPQTFMDSFIINEFKITYMFYTGSFEVYSLVLPDNIVENQYAENLNELTVEVPYTAEELKEKFNEDYFLWVHEEKDPPADEVLEAFTEIVLEFKTDFRERYSKDPYTDEELCDLVIQVLTNELKLDEFYRNTEERTSGASALPEIIIDKPLRTTAVENVTKSLNTITILEKVFSIPMKSNNFAEIEFDEILETDVIEFDGYTEHMFDFTKENYSGNFVIRVPEDKEDNKDTFVDNDISYFNITNIDGSSDITENNITEILGMPVRTYYGDAENTVFYVYNTDDESIELIFCFANEKLHEFTYSFIEN